MLLKEIQAKECFTKISFQYKVLKKLFMIMTETVWLKELNEDGLKIYD